MASQEHIEMVIKRLQKSTPVEFFKPINYTQAGMGAILHILHCSKKTITAGKISEAMNISAARVAVLLKKMASKGLITKETDPMDARVTIIKITELGKSLAEKREAEMFSQVGNVIDRIGIDRIMEFLEISEEIKSIVKYPNFKE